MDRPAKYVISVILSVFLVFSLLASAAMIAADLKLSRNACISLSVEKEIPQKIHDELERYYKEKYNSSGIPADVYMSALDNDYLKKVTDAYIDSGFHALEGDGEFVTAIPKNPALEASIDSFFNSYADEIGYEKDAAFEKKLEDTKSNAYRLIGSYCDVFKFSALSGHGVLPKLTKIYSHKALFTADIIGAAAIVLLLLMIVNYGSLHSVLYWSGISAAVAGLLGAVPCIFLCADRYFDSFTIKQPQIFAAFTGAMYSFTAAAAILFALLALAGAGLITAYCLTGRKKPAPVPVTENPSTGN